MTELTGPNKIIVDKIMHILEHFPKVSPSMLQISLGSGIPTEMWKPVLEAMIVEGMVHRYTQSSVLPSGRAQLLTCIARDPEEASVSA